MSTNKSTKTNRNSKNTGKKSAKTSKVSAARAGKSAGRKGLYSPSAKCAAKPNKVICLIFIIIIGVAALVAVTFITIWSTLRVSNSSYVFGYKTDAERFAAEYTQVDTNNVFVYKSGKEIIDILENGTGVVFLGFPSCPWCQAYAKILNEAAREQGLDKIYYHNTYDDWKNNTEEYQKITEILGNYLQYNNEGQRHLYVPDSVYVINGEIIGNDYETSKETLGAETPEEYWTDVRVNALKAKLGVFMQPIVAQDDCNTTCDR